MQTMLRAKPALLCLHYYAGSGEEWELLVHELSLEFACYTPDLGGFGDAAPPEDGFSVAAYADEVEAYINLLCLDNYVLVGHSMGGKIAMTVAARKPEGLQGLVLLSPSPPPGEPIPEEDRKRLLKEYGDAKAAWATFHRITTKPLADESKQQVIEDNLRSNKLAYDAWLLQGSKEDISVATKAIAVPILLLAGTADEAITPQTHRELTLPHLPADVEVKWIEGAGHLLPLEVPVETATVIREWTNKHFACTDR